MTNLKAFSLTLKWNCHTHGFHPTCASKLRIQFTKKQQMGSMHDTCQVLRINCIYDAREVLWWRHVLYGMLWREDSEMFRRKNNQPHAPTTQCFETRRERKMKSILNETCHAGLKLIKLRMNCWKRETERNRHLCPCSTVPYVDASLLNSILKITLFWLDKCEKAQGKSTLQDILPSKEINL